MSQPVFDVWDVLFWYAIGIVKGACVGWWITEYREFKKRNLKKGSRRI